MLQLNNIGVVILAAGASSRLGKPKQLLEYDEKSLLQHTIDAANRSGANSVIVVLGSNADIISKEIDRTTIQIENKDWQEGMASSIRAGLDALVKLSPATEAVIFLVCDQPHISPGVIKELMNSQGQTGKPIVTCNYGETIGPPALFHRSLFHELMQLKGDTGARKIIQQHPDDVATVLFTKGKIDIDTNEDYQALKNS